MIVKNVNSNLLDSCYVIIQEIPFEHIPNPDKLFTRLVNNQNNNLYTTDTGTLNWVQEISISGTFLITISNNRKHQYEISGIKLGKNLIPSIEIVDQVYRNSNRISNLPLIF